MLLILNCPSCPHFINCDFVSVSIVKKKILKLNLFSEKVTISNDGATILGLLDIVHPAAKTLVDIARSQDAEVRFTTYISIVLNKLLPTF